ncbi:MAG: CPBP family intramembrane glutamic endopeptidase [Bacilli bacterium]
MKLLTRGFIIFLIYFLYSFFLFLPLELLTINFQTLPSSIKIIYLLGTDLLFVLLLIVVYFKDLTKDYQDFKTNYHIYIDESIKYWIIGLILMVVSNVLITTLTPSGTPPNEVAVRDMLTKLPLYTFFGATIFAPLVEELIFRKALFDIIKNKWVYVLMSGFIFGFLHVITSYHHYYELFFIIPYGSLGCAFAYLYYKTKNIINPILVHTIHNTGLVLLFLFTK